MPPNPVTYPYSTWEPDASGADSNHPVTLIDPMSAGSSNDAAGWVRLLESQMRRRSSVNGCWEEWLGVNTPYSPSSAAPAFIDAHNFSLTGDWTTASAGNYGPIAVVGRRIKVYTTGNPSPVGLQGTITAASFAAGITTITAFWDNSLTIDASLNEVQFGIPAISAPTISLFKESLQVINNTPSAETALVLNIGANERWLFRFGLYTNGTIGGGGSFVLSPSGPGSTSYNMAVNSSGVAVAAGTSPTLTLTMTNNYFALDMFVATSATPGNVTLLYSSNNITQVLSGSYLLANKLAGV